MVMDWLEIAGPFVPEWTGRSGMRNWFSPEAFVTCQGWPGFRYLETETY